MQIIIYTILGVIGIFVLGTLYLRIRNHFLKRSRREDKKEDYIQYFEGKNLSKKLALDVHEYLSDWMSQPDFPVRPSDNLSNVYGIVDEDLEDFIQAITETNGLKLPENSDYWLTPVVTVEDLVSFVMTFSQKNVKSEK